MEILMWSSLDRSFSDSWIIHWFTSPRLVVSLPPPPHFLSVVPQRRGSRLGVDKVWFESPQFALWVDAVIFVFSLEDEISFQAVYHYFSRLASYRNPADLPLVLVGTQGPTHTHTHTRGLRRVKTSSYEWFQVELCPHDDRNTCPNTHTSSVFLRTCCHLLVHLQHYSYSYRISVFGDSILSF